jgi:hypothetical protein
MFQISGGKGRKREPKYAGDFGYYDFKHWRSLPLRFADARSMVRQWWTPLIQETIAPESRLMTAQAGFK